MKFLLDEQLPPGLRHWIAAQGHDADHVTRLHPRPGDDLAVADRAADEGWVVLSKDRDFLALCMARSVQLVWIRCGNLKRSALMEWLAPRWAGMIGKLEAGDALVELR